VTAKAASVAIVKAVASAATVARAGRVKTTQQQR
jgi:hypothetical protein